LSNGRTFRYYFDTILLAGLALFFFYLDIRDVIENQVPVTALRLLNLLSLSLIALICYFIQRSSLKFQQILNGFSTEDNYDLAKETLRKLQWQVEVDEAGLIEAHTSGSGFWAGGNQMFSIIITGRRILFNSIGNVDTYIPQLMVRAQNRRNMRRFRKRLELVVRNRASKANVL
jgi:hypothetical protein